MEGGDRINGSKETQRVGWKHESAESSEQNGQMEVVSAQQVRTLDRRRARREPREAPRDEEAPAENVRQVGRGYVTMGKPFIDPRVFETESWRQELIWVQRNKLGIIVGMQEKPPESADVVPSMAMRTRKVAGQGD